jgi:hypothetical protein
MFVFVFDGALLRFSVKTPSFAPLFQFPPRMKPRARVFDAIPSVSFAKKQNKNKFWFRKNNFYSVPCANFLRHPPSNLPISARFVTAN